MLASNGMRLARELRSPLFPALAPGGCRDLLRPRSGVVCAAVARGSQRSFSSGCCSQPRARPTARWSSRRSSRSRSGARSRSPGRSSPTGAGTTRTARSSTSGSPSSARTSRATSRRLLFGFSGLLGVVCVWALAGKVFPWLHEGYGRIARLSAPIGYWNALALLGDIALPIGPLPRDPAANGRDAARLRLARRDRADLLARRRPRRDRRGRALDDPLEGLARDALDAARRRAPRDRLAGRRLRPLRGHERRAVAHHACPRRARVRRRARSSNAAIAAALSRYELPATSLVRRLALVALAVVVAVSLAAGAAHAHSWWSTFTKPSGDRAHQLADRLVQLGLELPLGVVDAGLGRLGSEPDRRHRRRLASTSRTSATAQSSLDETIEPHSLPVQFLSETGLVGVALFLGSIGWLIVRGRRRPGPQLALALALTGLLPARGCSTSTGTSSRSRRPCS